MVIDFITRVPMEKNNKFYLIACKICYVLERLKNHNQPKKSIQKIFLSKGFDFPKVSTLPFRCQTKYIFLSLSFKKWNRKKVVGHKCPTVCTLFLFIHIFCGLRSCGQTEDVQRWKCPRIEASCPAVWMGPFFAW